MFYINLEISLYKAKNADRRLNIEGISSAIDLAVILEGLLWYNELRRVNGPASYF